MNIYLVIKIEKLGCYMISNILYQDNQTEMKMKNNGKASTTGKSRNFHIQYLFQSDCVGKREIKIQHFSLYDILADCLQNLYKELCLRNIVI